MKAITLVALVLLAGCCTASRYNNDDGNRQQQQTQKAQPFRSGNEYTFMYNGQIASGLDVSGSTNAPTPSDEPQQKAVTRLQAQVKIAFESDQRATLRLSQIKLGQLNQPIESPQQVQSMSKFENKEIEEEKKKTLELPIQFSYNQGVVESIQFQADDQTWSKNIKRGVLNMIQLNLKRQEVRGGQQQQQQWDMDSAEQQYNQQEESNQSPYKTFTLPEISVEGECETTYTISKNKKSQQGQSNNIDQSNQNDEQQQQDDQQQSSFNVTKTINFKKCKQIADVAYGYQNQQQQPQCVQCKLIQQEQQQHKRQAYGPQQQQSQQCTQECDPKEVKEQKLDRTTIVRFVLNGRGSNQQYGIKRTELVSQYVYKNLRSDSAAHSSAMQTIVAAELVFQSTQQKQQQSQGFRAGNNNQKDTLLYDNEWDVEEKHFYMNGDDGERGNNSPFSKTVNKVEQAYAILRRLVQSVSDKPNGIEWNEAEKLQRLVELLRMCTTNELKNLYKQNTGNNDQTSSQSKNGEQQQQQKAELILADALAIAGTRNTIQVLVEKILKKEINPNQGAQSLKQLSNLPAPSDKQADIVLQLCQNEIAHRNPMLKQSCWLTFGSVVGELCQQKSQKGNSEKSKPVFGFQSGYVSQHQCSPSKKQAYKEALMREYREAQKEQNTYEQVLVLKAIGNAGIDTTVHSLEQIINERQESPIVRAQAIDSLRRLRTQMPRKVQRVLLPFLQNTREQPLVRMTALSMIIRTNPEQSVIDQVVYTLSKERNPQVQSLAYTSLKSLSKSKISAYQHIAQHLKNALKLANVDEQQLQASRFYTIPVYSNEQKEGAFISFASVFGTRNTILPNHLTAIVDTLFNDEFEQNALKIALTQQGIEQWYEGLIQTLLNGKQRKSMSRGDRYSQNSPNSRQEELRNIFRGLSVKRRSMSYQSWGSDEDQDQDQQENRQSRNRQSKNEPFAMITVRLGDVDSVILPISRQTMPRCLNSLANGQKPNLADCVNAVKKANHFRTISVMNLMEKSAKIPTSMGIPLRLLQATPVLTAIEGQASINSDRSEGVAMKAQLSLHPTACVVHIQKMETWSPMISTGVKSTRAIEMNIPIQGDVQVNTETYAVKAALKLPVARTHLFGIHTLPATYTRDFDSKVHVLREPKVKSVQVPQLEQLQRDIDHVVGKQATGMPLRIQGHIHRPVNPTDFKQIMQLAMSTENHMHVKYEPTSDDSSKEIIVRVEPAPFGKTSTRGPSLDNFYSKNSEFNRPSNEEDFDDLESHDQRRSKLNTFLNKFQSQMYKHQLKVSIEAKGGRKPAKVETTASASCDSKFKFCKMNVIAERTPMLANEKSDWNLRADMQILTPESVSNVHQLQQMNSDDKNRKLVVQGDAEWGAEHKQMVNFRIQGEKAHTRQWRQQISSQYEGPLQKFQEKQAAFLNKFDLVAEYKLRPSSQNVLQKAFELLKSRYASFWNTHEQQQESGSDSQVRDGQLRATFIIDPITQQHANVTLKTMTKNVRIDTMELPIKMRPFSLVRQQDQSSHSTSQLFSRLAVGRGRAECSVDGKRVETFDQVLYKAPIGKCYSVLAKDCSNEDRPQFAVMMKTLQNGQDKKIKVITPEQTIECKPVKDAGEKKLQCKVNGQTVSASNEQEQQQGQEENNGPLGQIVEYNNEEQTDATINVQGVQVRFGCWGSQGCKSQKAWIKISSQYKEGQCGLCGHYDDESEDELRMANNEQTRDLQKFHRSYTLRDGQDDECSGQDQDDFYSKSNSNKFRGIGFQSSNEQNNDNQDSSDEFNFIAMKNKKMIKKNQGGQYNKDSEEEQDQWQAGAYHTDGSSSEEDQWGRHGSKQNKRWLKKKGGRRNQMDNQNWADEDPESPIEATKVIEYNHKICFSVNKVKQCPQGSYPADDSEGQQKKTQFACLSRSDPQARQMQREARKGLTVDMSNQQPAFVEMLREPSRCVVY